MLKAVLWDKRCHSNRHPKWLCWCSHKWTLCSSPGKSDAHEPVFEITGKPCRKQGALYSNTELQSHQRVCRIDSWLCRRDWVGLNIVWHQARCSQFLDGRWAGNHIEYHYFHQSKYHKLIQIIFLFTVHKDPYENMYCVVSGYKDFILHPPTDQPWIPYANYPKASYQEIDGDLKIVPDDDGTIPWIDIDPLKPDLTKYPKYKNARQIRCRVEKGEMLYLPSLWFHHVRQSHGCIAVNYWYDMQYDIKYNYFEFVKDLVNCDAWFANKMSLPVERRDD